MKMKMMMKMKMKMKMKTEKHRVISALKSLKSQTHMVKTSGKDSNNKVEAAWRKTFVNVARNVPNSFLKSITTMTYKSTHRDQGVQDLMEYDMNVVMMPRRTLDSIILALESVAHDTEE